jgi:hypothetical protein
MTLNASPARANRLLGYCALAHAASAWALTFLAFSSDSSWQRRSWVAFVTLWIVWPVALAAHRGRSVLRFVLFAFLGSALLWPSLLFYNHLAPDVFGLPIGMKMNPVSAWKFCNGYLAGRTQAQKDIAAGILAIEDAGLKPGHERWDGPVLRKRFQIEIRTIEGSTFEENEFGHQAGYNSVSFRVIDRRFGWDRVQAARGEAFATNR